MLGVLRIPASIKITVNELNVEKYIPRPMPHSLSEDCGVRKAE